jgi:ankyrin repeat protein
MCALVGCSSSANGLAEAAESGDVEKIDALVKGGADVNFRGSENVTPLLRSLRAKNKEGFAALLRHGADPNAFDTRGFAPTNEAALDDDSYWLQEALKNGGNANLVTDGNPIAQGWTPIYYAISSRRLENVKLLCKAGADLNHKNMMQSCPLLWAAQRPAYDIVLVLLQAGADFRQKNSADDDLIVWISRRNDGFVVEDEQKLWFAKTVQFLKAQGAKFDLSKD